MAKGQKRSTKEPRKPKQSTAKPPQPGRASMGSVLGKS